MYIISIVSYTYNLYFKHWNITYKNMIKNGIVNMIFNKYAAPARYSKLKLYTVLYNEVVKIDSNAVHNRVIELSRPKTNRRTSVYGMTIY